MNKSQGKGDQQSKKSFEREDLINLECRQIPLLWMASKLLTQLHKSEEETWKVRLRHICTLLRD